MPVKKGDSKQKFYEVKQWFANLSRNDTTSFFWNSFGDLLPLFSWYWLTLLPLHWVTSLSWNILTLLSILELHHWTPAIHWKRSCPLAICFLVDEKQNTCLETSHLACQSECSDSSLDCSLQINNKLLNWRAIHFRTVRGVNIYPPLLWLSFSPKLLCKLCPSKSSMIRLLPQRTHEKNNR